LNQIKKFKSRKRFEEPEFSQQKILSDAYLTYVYESVLSRQLDSVIKEIDSIVVELGASGGISKKKFPKIITLDVRKGPDVDIVFDSASTLPFSDQSVNLVIAKDVLHHINNAQCHFTEMNRILVPGGRVVYTEPNWNFVSNFVFSFLHPEPFITDQKNWSFDSEDPMFSNQALAKIIFVRDIELFKKENPGFDVKIDSNPTNGLSFMLSGGVYRRSRIPSQFLIGLDKIERRFPRWLAIVGLSRTIELIKT
jgi:SAM-dependent methyltransferase